MRQALLYHLPFRPESTDGRGVMKHAVDLRMPWAVEPSDDAVDGTDVLPERSVAVHLYPAPPHFRHHMPLNGVEVVDVGEGRIKGVSPEVVDNPRVAVQGVFTPRGWFRQA